MRVECSRVYKRLLCGRTPLIGVEMSSKINDCYMSKFVLFLCETSWHFHKIKIRLRFRFQFSRSSNCPERTRHWFAPSQPKAWNTLNWAVSKSDKNLSLRDGYRKHSEFGFWLYRPKYWANWSRISEEKGGVDIFHGKNKNTNVLPPYVIWLLQSHLVLKKSFTGVREISRETETG